MGAAPIPPSQLVVDAFLMRVRVELYTAAQSLLGEDLVQLQTLLGEVTTVVEIQLEEQRRADEASRRGVE